ncbi:MAG: DUF2997 domain-containing protein [Candidatus Bathyarchaeia archaeon]
MRIIILISPEGDIKIEVEGMKGPGCREIASAFSSLLGEKVSEELKPEFFQKVEGKIEVGSGSGGRKH